MDCLPVKHPRQQEHHRRVVQAAVLAKAARGCAECGYAENGLALEFDHVEGGGGHAHHDRGPVNTFAALERVLADPNIQVLCGNCHNVKSNLARMPWWTP